MSGPMFDADLAGGYPTGESKPAGRWVIIDFFGHQRFAGRVSEIQQFGATMGRLEIPTVDGRPGFTKDFGGSSIFQITDVTEEIAVAFTRQNRPTPVQRYEVTMLPAFEGAPVTQDGEEVDSELCGSCLSDPCVCEGSSG